MGYDLIIKKSAEKEYLKLHNPIRIKIQVSILNLKDNPHPYGHKKLKNRKEFRIRVNDYRILYQVNESEKLVTILRIRHRRDVYNS